MHNGRARRIAPAAIALFILVAGTAALGGGPAARANASSRQAFATPIQHVVVILEENRSFDNYFGAFPGLGTSCGAAHVACGINTAVCLPDPANATCVHPYLMRNSGNSNYVHDLPHDANSEITDVDGGKMDGFITAEQKRCGCKLSEAMAYFDGKDVPVFWRYAKNYALQDNFFEPVIGWSFPAHLFMLSEWSATCTSQTDPMSCSSAPNPYVPRAWSKTWPGLTLPWTDMTWLLHKNGVSWAYYVANGTEPDCDPTGCTQASQDPGTPSWWNPLPWFLDVQQDGQLGNIRGVSSLFSDLSSGSLPNVSWIVPNNVQSGHPPKGTNPASEAYVVSLINAIEASSAWKSTAILLAWDDWGGEYDHVRPPTVDGLGFGLRVPSILISPYAKKGYIDNAVQTFDTYNKFIENNFLNRERLDPATDQRPDSRPSVRESNPILGGLTNDLDFTQSPAAPILFPTLSLPSSITPGAAVTVSGAHFAPGDTVQIMVNCGAPDCNQGTVVKQVQASATNGTFTTTFTAPSTLAAGTDYVSAEGTDALTYFAVNSTTVS
jgi:phospholipase C